MSGRSFARVASCRVISVLQKSVEELVRYSCIVGENLIFDHFVGDFQESHHNILDFTTLS